MKQTTKTLQFEGCYKAYFQYKNYLHQLCSKSSKSAEGLWFRNQGTCCQKVPGYCSLANQEPTMVTTGKYMIILK